MYKNMMYTSFFNLLSIKRFSLFPLVCKKVRAPFEKFHCPHRENMIFRSGSPFMLGKSTHPCFSLKIVITFTSGGILRSTRPRADKIAPCKLFEEYSSPPFWDNRIGSKNIQENFTPFLYSTADCFNKVEWHLCHYLFDVLFRFTVEILQR